MEVKYLVDSNAIIDFCSGKLPINGKNLLLAIVPEISIITNIELFANKNINNSEIEFLKKFVSFSIVHDLNIKLVNTTIEIRKMYNIKLPDAVIAATAIVHNLVLVTRNTKDFQNIQNLKVVNPYD
jgi:predicted nucleic acid-binding protein